MLRIHVQSSNIESVGYDETTSILEIVFKQNRTYQFYEVPKSVFDSLINAPSHGKYFYSHIKAVYRFKEL